MTDEKLLHDNLRTFRRVAEQGRINYLGFGAG